MSNKEEKETIKKAIDLIKSLINFTESDFLKLKKAINDVAKKHNIVLDENIKIAASVLGKKGGSKTSPDKKKSSPENGKKPPKPGSAPRGWPKGKPRKEK